MQYLFAANLKIYHYDQRLLLAFSLFGTDYASLYIPNQFIQQFKKLTHKKDIQKNLKYLQQTTKTNKYYDQQVYDFFRKLKEILQLQHKQLIKVSNKDKIIAQKKTHTYIGRNKFKSKLNCLKCEEQDDPIYEQA